MCLVPRKTGSNHSVNSNVQGIIVASCIIPTLLFLFSVCVCLLPSQPKGKTLVGAFSALSLWEQGRSREVQQAAPGARAYTNILPDTFSPALTATTCGTPALTKASPLNSESHELITASSVPPCLVWKRFLSEPTCR